MAGSKIQLPLSSLHNRTNFILLPNPVESRSQTCLTVTEGLKIMRILKTQKSISDESSFALRISVLDGLISSIFLGVPLTSSIVQLSRYIKYKTRRYSRRMIILSATRYVKDGSLTFLDKCQALSEIMEKVGSCLGLKGISIADGTTQSMGVAFQDSAVVTIGISFSQIVTAFILVVQYRLQATFFALAFPIYP